MTVRVVLADDQEVVRAGLRTILELADEITVVGEAADGLAAVELARALVPDVVLMDVRMPEMDGIEMAKAAATAFPGMRIVLMTGYAEQRERADDLASKIVDVVSKPFSLPDIRRAVATALAA